MTTDEIPFNVPYLTGRELEHARVAVDGRARPVSDGFTQRCRIWLERNLRCERALLTHSCTSALEMAALVMNIGPGDEVIVPSYTYVSTASAFALRGAEIVFVDIEPGTFNVDPQRVKDAVTQRTRAIVPVHYAGVACEMTSLQRIATAHRLTIVEDAAQALLADTGQDFLGTLGDFGAISFHETKNISCGRGGALLVNNPEFAVAVELATENGSDRARFHRSEVSQYTWRTLGTSFQMNELSAAYLFGQLEHAHQITSKRLEVWNRYHDSLADLELDGCIRRPNVPAGRSHNGHIYHVLLAPGVHRHTVLNELQLLGVQCCSHFVPLHSSPAGARFGRAHGSMAVTNDVAKRILRLPLWADMDSSTLARVVESLGNVLRKIH